MVVVLGCSLFLGGNTCTPPAAVPPPTAGLAENHALTPAGALAHAAPPAPPSDHTRHHHKWPTIVPTAARATAAGPPISSSKPSIVYGRYLTGTVKTPKSEDEEPGGARADERYWRQCMRGRRNVEGASGVESVTMRMQAKKSW